MCLLTSCAFAAGDSESGGAPTAEFRDARAYVVGLVERGEIPSAAVAVLKGDEVVWAEGFGLANRQTGAKATPDTIYRLASISKPITATGLMIQVDRGRVDLDAPANRYLAGAKLSARAGDADAITVRRLANHTAGLPLHYNLFYDGHPATPIDESIRRYGFAATEPGKAWEYSNFAFGVLGLITEAASGSPWRTFMDGELYGPLGMIRTSDRVRPGHEAEGAVPYSRDVSGRFVPVGDYGFDHPGASAIWSSANDMMRFARMHLRGGELDGVRVLSERAIKAMQEPTGRRGEGSAMGVSWAITTERGHRCISHTGGMPGVSTVLRIFPDDRAALIVLINSNTHSVNRSLATRLTRALFPDGGAKDEQEEDDGPSRSEDRDVGGSWAGGWTGKLVHPDGDVPLKLTLEAPRTARVACAGRPPVELSEVALRDGRLHARLDGLLFARPDYHGVSWLDFKLSLKGDRLVGVATATGPEYYALPHWVELARAPATEVAVGEAEYDLLLKAGRVVDGCGTPWYVADVGIRDGRIAAVGRLGDAKAGRVVATQFTLVDPAGKVRGELGINEKGQPTLELTGNELGRAIFGFQGSEEDFSYMELSDRQGRQRISATTEKDGAEISLMSPSGPDGVKLTQFDPSGPSVTLSRSKDDPNIQIGVTSVGGASVEIFDIEGNAVKAISHGGQPRLR
ncbi:serine hydrolase [Singulisphaera sp. PoT]|uniref:serine hydrolase domain-containing protein n=1 Tax=Singulisphaera sp. PoT TaxID=3411797 RepID=UPI003BF4A29F